MKLYTAHDENFLPSLVGVLLILIAAWGVNWLFSGRNPLVEEAYRTCQSWMTEELVAPATARYPALGDLHRNKDFGEIEDSCDPTKGGERCFTFLSYVDSQNKFGAMLRSDFRCEILLDRDTGEWRGNVKLLDQAS